MYTPGGQFGGPPPFSDHGPKFPMYMQGVQQGMTGMQGAPMAMHGGSFVGPMYDSSQAYRDTRGMPGMRDYCDRLDRIEFELGSLKQGSSGINSARNLGGAPMLADDPAMAYPQQPAQALQMQPAPLAAGQATPTGAARPNKEHLELLKSYNDLLQVHTDLVKLHTELVTGKSGTAAGSGSAATKHLATAPEVPVPASAAAPPQPGYVPIVSNSAAGHPPPQPTLMDNTHLYLPKVAVVELGLEPNMNDKGDATKELWFGRVWELRALLGVQYRARVHAVLAKQSGLTKQAKQALAQKLRDPMLKARLVKLQARWRGTAYRRRLSLAFLERLRFSNVRATLIYCHGSGGCSWDNMRICRMLCNMGVLVISPDDFAYPKNTAMGQLRHKDLLPLHLANDDVDYWTGDLIYSSGSSGTATYSTKADKVLEEPENYRELYEKCYQLRRSEMHLIIHNLPLFIKTQGFFIGGTSEGAMTVCRFDDQRYGEMVIGRFINSFGMEYCYFTPTPEAGQLGGQLDVPTLNIIGTKDQYFGPESSVAKIVAEDDETGYGSKELTGNGYKTMVRQGVETGLVCVLEDGVHSPCNTHDNFLRQLFETFFMRPGAIWELDAIWEADPTKRAIIQVVQSSANDKAKEGTNVVQLFVPTMKFPNKWTLRKVEAMRHYHSAAATAELDSAMKQEQEAKHKDQADAKSMLDGIRAHQRKSGGAGFTKEAPRTHVYYEKDKQTKVQKKRVKHITSRS